MEYKTSLTFLALSLVLPTLGSQDIVMQISTMRWSQVVSERFLSLSIDPLAIIVAGKIGPAAMHMAKGLTPIFLRIGGPNTENIHFGQSSSTRNNISISEEEWVAVNRFAQEARLDVVLCLRAMRRTQSVWDSTNALDIISASHKHGFTDIWQMGWDMSEMTGIGGAELGRDIVRLKKILDAFPGYENAPILAPGLSCCLNHFQTKFIKELLHESSTAVSALPVHLNFSGISIDKISETIGSTLVQMEEQIWNKDLLLRTNLPRKPIWMCEVEPSSGTFKDAMNWIVKLGSAAKFGVQVMMRQPNLLSFHSPTHDYWASLLYKNLVGRFVFDGRITNGNKSTTYLYSHCAHPTADDTTILASKWSYEKGAVTVFGVNPLSEGAKISIKGLSMKEEMVHLYVLTEEETGSFKENTKWHPMHTLFNGQKLTLSPSGELPLLTPKIRRISRNQLLSVPPNSIFFVVYPDVRVRMCMSNPFATDEFQDLSKRLTTPHPHSDDTIDSWEDNNAERVYVSFSKRVPVPHKHQEDLKSKLLKDFHKVAGRLGIEKEQAEMETESPVKYNFFNDQTWLSRLTEGMKKENNDYPDLLQEELRKTDEETERSRLEKYALLTSAIYGKENDSSKLLRVSKDGSDIYLNHYRHSRSIDNAQLEDSIGINQESEINTSQENIDQIPYVKNEQDVINHLENPEKYNDMHDYIINYAMKSGQETDPMLLSTSVGYHPLSKFIDDLKHVDITVSGAGITNQEMLNPEDNQKVSVITSEEAVCSSKKRDKRSPLRPELDSPNNNNEYSNSEKYSEPRSGVKRGISKVLESIDIPETYVSNDDKISSFSNIKKNDLSKIINENLEKGAAFEVAPEPEDGQELNPEQNQETNNLENDESTDSDINNEGARIKKSGDEQNLSSVRINSNEILKNYTDDDNGLNDGENKNNGTINNEESVKNFLDNEMNQLKTYDGKSLEEDLRDTNLYADDDDVLKEPIKYKKLSDIIDQIKAKSSSLKDLPHPSSYRSAKLEERIQKLELIKSRVIEIKEKIKDELSRAREKLALNIESMKTNSDYKDNEQPAKRNIYDVPDKLAGILERLNFNYMSNIKPKMRYTRHAILSDDEIDELLERELAETANDFYDEQISALQDQDYNENDQSNYRYLVPYMRGTHNLMMDEQIFPAKIYNMVKRNKYNRYNDNGDDENLDFNERIDSKDLYDTLRNYQNNYDDLENFRSPFDNDDDYDEQIHNLFKSNQHNLLRNNLMKNKYRQMLQSSSEMRRRPFTRGNKQPIFVYPHDLLDDDRYKRSLKNENLRQKRKVNEENIYLNSIVKKLPLKDIEKDDIKLEVDNKYKNSNIGLHDLALEYTKLFEDKANGIKPIENDIVKGINEISANVEQDGKLNNEIAEEISTIISNPSKILDNELNTLNNDLLNSSKDDNEIIDKSKEDYMDYEENWTENAERVSPPIKKTKKHHKENTAHRSNSPGSPLSRLIEKIKYIIKMISEFGISDYLKGKRRSENSKTNSMQFVD